MEEDIIMGQLVQEDIIKGRDDTQGGHYNR